MVAKFLTFSLTPYSVSSMVMHCELASWPKRMLGQIQRQTRVAGQADMTTRSSSARIAWSTCRQRHSVHGGHFEAGVHASHWAGAAAGTTWPGAVGGSGETAKNAKAVPDQASFA
jgi:hypothetical protein